MAEAVYILSAATALLCAVLLWRGYRRSQLRLLLWSSLCFIALAVNNVLLFLDKVVFPDLASVAGVEFTILRTLAALAGLALLVYGLIWEAE
ncbi:MAG: DUF5985 family protein [Tepidisphaeraceae bacterium]